MSTDAPSGRREPGLVRKLRERQRTHKERGVLYRAAFVAAGVTLLLAGLAMVVLPGPAFVVIPIGLAILALEFAWADRLLEKALMQAESAKEKAGRTSTRTRLLGGLAIACAVAAFVVLAILYDITFLPV